jgi:hypothetical protein
MSNINPDNKVKQLLDRLNKIDQKAILIKVIQENEIKLIDVLRDQMRMGLSGSGDIQPGYFPAYLNYKKSLSSYNAGNKVDLYLTGNFQNTMFIRISGTQYEFDSRDWKRTDLLEKYGEDIFALNSLSKELGQELITPKYLEEYAKELNA